MPGHVPSFARSFFHFQRNSGFMKILYSLLKCVCVCAHVLYILGRENLSETAGFDWEFSAHCHPYFINFWEAVIKFYPHLHPGEAGVVRKSESPWEAGPPVKRSSFFLLLPSSPAFPSSLRITDSQKRIYCLSQRQFSKSIVFLCQAFEKNWEAGNLALYSLLNT